jgi:hypothetical protein
MTDDQSIDEPEVFPSDEEIPDEPLNVNDIDPFSVNDDNFEDIDSFSAAEWKEQSTADERIRTVIKRTTTMKSAAQISDIALVSETRTRKILKELAEEGVVRIHQKDSENLYIRN